MISNKENILKNEVETTKARNIMGCSENWYNSYYAIQQTFTREEIEAMSEAEVNNLVKLAKTIAEGLY